MKCERWIDQHDMSMGQWKIWIPNKNCTHDLPNTWQALYPLSKVHSLYIPLIFILCYFSPCFMQMSYSWYLITAYHCVDFLIFLLWLRGGGMMQWGECSPPTNKARFVFWPSAICGLSLLLILALLQGFLQVLQFSSLHKNQHSKF